MVGETGLHATDRSRAVVTGIAGIASLVLVMGSQALVQVGGGEPSFDAPAEDILRFFAARHDTLYAAGSFLGLIAALALLWFFAGVWAVLRSIEGEPAWRSLVAVISGAAFVVVVLNPGWDLAGFRVDEGVDPQLARFAFDQGNLGFANAWVALASFLLAAGWILVPAHPMLGWWAVVAGVGFLVGRASWTTSIWLIPYALFWIWTVAVSVQLMRGRLRSEPSQARLDRLGPGME